MSPRIRLALAAALTALLAACANPTAPSNADCRGGGVGTGSGQCS